MILATQQGDVEGRVVAEAGEGCEPRHPSLLSSVSIVLLTRQEPRVVQSERLLRGASAPSSLAGGFKVKASCRSLSKTDNLGREDSYAEAGKMVQQLANCCHV